MDGELMRMKTMMVLLSFLIGCESLEPISPKAPCVETGYAIARRTFECTGDTEAANARYQQFRSEYSCIAVEYNKDVVVSQYTVDESEQPGNYFHCSFAIGELACELVQDYGNDLELWLDSSPICPLVVEAR